jgi:hypothetical protein
VGRGIAKHELVEALELDPSNQIEDGEADAVCLTDLPNDVIEVSRATGSIDRPSYALAIALFAGGLFDVARLGAGCEGRGLHLGIRFQNMRKLSGPRRRVPPQRGSAPSFGKSTTKLRRSLALSTPRRELPLSFSANAETAVRW